MVAGGHNGNYLSDVEIVDLSSHSTACFKPANMPIQNHLMIGDFLTGNVAKICGGSSPNVGNTANCYDYDYDTNTWSLAAYNLPGYTYEAVSWCVENGKWPFSVHYCRVRISDTRA